MSAMSKVTQEEEKPEKADRCEEATPKPSFGLNRNL